MCLSESAENIFLFLHENGEIILIDLLFGIVIILPDKTAILSVLRNSGITDDFPVFVDGIKIKDKYPAGIDNCSPAGIPAKVPLLPKYN